MSARLILPSSEVSRLWSNGPHWLLQLSAATAQLQLPQPTQGPRVHDMGAVWGHFNGVTVTFREARVEGDVALALGTLAECELHHNGQPLRHLDMPCELNGRVVCTLGFHNGTELQLVATGLSTPRADLDRFRESMAC
jgi:hypothetical protein